MSHSDQQSDCMGCGAPATHIARTARDAGTLCADCARQSAGNVACTRLSALFAREDLDRIGTGR